MLLCYSAHELFNHNLHKRLGGVFAERSLNG